MDNIRFTRRRFLGLVTGALAAGWTSQLTIAANMPLIILGDSQADGLALGLQRQGIPVVNQAVGGSGLVDPAAVDWQARVREVAAERPQSVCVLMGTNDALKVDATYPQRVRDFLTPLAVAGTRLWWIASPPTAFEAQNAGIAQINAIVAAEVARVRGTVLTPVTTFDPMTRTEDGIHFRQFGYDRLATEVRQLIGL